MANPNVAARLDKIAGELNALRKHIAYHSGVDPKRAMQIDNLATACAVEAAHIAAEARIVGGTLKKSESFIKSVRKALGFSYP